MSGDRKLELWRDTASADYLAEVMVLENAHATAAPPQHFHRRKHQTVEPIVKDTRTSKEVKNLHRPGVLRLKLQTNGGPYTEGAHIRPLGRPIMQTQPTRYSVDVLLIG